MKLLDLAKEHKESLLMITGSVSLLADVILCIRNGIKMKRKLETLPEDATNLDKVKAIAPEAAEIVLLTGFTYFCFWDAHKTDLNKLITTGSVAALYKERAEKQDKAVRETVDEKTYSEIKGRKVKEHYSTNVVNKPMVHDGDGEIMVDEFTNAPLQIKPENLMLIFTKWQRDFTSSVVDYNPRDDEYIPMATLLETYFDEMINTDVYDNFGWKKKDVANLKLDIHYPVHADPLASPWGKPYLVFSYSIDPELMPTKFFGGDWRKSDY